jgi:hypothetical protein
VAEEASPHLDQEGEEEEEEVRMYWKHPITSIAQLRAPERLYDDGGAHTAVWQWTAADGTIVFDRALPELLVVLGKDEKEAPGDFVSFLNHRSMKISPLVRVMPDVGGRRCCEGSAARLERKAEEAKQLQGQKKTGRLSAWDFDLINDDDAADMNFDTGIELTSNPTRRALTGVAAKNDEEDEVFYHSKFTEFVSIDLDHNATGDGDGGEDDQLTGLGRHSINSWSRNPLRKHDGNVDTAIESDVLDNEDLASDATLAQRHLSTALMSLPSKGGNLRVQNERLLKQNSKLTATNERQAALIKQLQLSHVRGGTTKTIAIADHDFDLSHAAVEFDPYVDEWFYEDADDSTVEHGPFQLHHLMEWREGGFFLNEQEVTRKYLKPGKKKTKKKKEENARLADPMASAITLLEALHRGGLDDDAWWYDDAVGNVHGPFSIAQLEEWLAGGHFENHHGDAMLVRKGKYGIAMTLHQAMASPGSAGPLLTIGEAAVDDAHGSAANDGEVARDAAASFDFHFGTMLSIFNDEVEEQLEGAGDASELDAVKAEVSSAAALASPLFKDDDGSEGGEEVGDEEEDDDAFVLEV